MICNWVHSVTVKSQKFDHLENALLVVKMEMDASIFARIPSAVPGNFQESPAQTPLGAGSTNKESTTPTLTTSEVFSKVYELP